MPRWRDDRVQEIRQRLAPQDEGSLWIFYLEDPYGEALLASAVADAMAQMDRHMTENLAMIITSVAPKAVLLVVPRSDGKPLAVDSQLWRDLQDLLSGSTTELTDLLVVGRSRCCRHGTPWHDWQSCGHATSGGPRVLPRHSREGLIWWSSAGEAPAQAAIS